jgi:hypothetical protein
MELQHSDLASWSGGPWRRGLLGLAVMAGTWLIVPAWPLPDRAWPDFDRFPKSGRGWTSELANVDRRFIGSLPQSLLWHRIYEHERKRKLDLDHEVSFYVVVEPADRPRSSPWSSKLLTPGRGWELFESEWSRDYALDREITKGIASDGQQRAVVYTWVARSQGTLIDSLRSLLALERGPFARETPRVVVRLASSIEAAGSEARAKQALDRFIFDFREELLAL